MRTQQGIFSNIDWVIVGIYLVMVLLGWMNIYAAAYNPEHPSIFDFSQRYGKQLLWIGVAFLIAIVLLIIEGDFFTKTAYIFYGITILLLLAVLVVGKKVNGAKAWIEIGAFSLQPAEFAKVACSLAMAKYLSTVEPRIKEYFGTTLLFLSSIVAFLLEIVFVGYAAYMLVNYSLTEVVWIKLEDLSILWSGTLNEIAWIFEEDITTIWNRKIFFLLTTLVVAIPGILYIIIYNVLIRDFDWGSIRGILGIFLIIFIPAGLIILQPDLGSDLVFAAFLFVLFREGLPGSFLLYGFFAAILFVLALIINKVDLICVLISLCFFSYLIIKKHIDTTIYFALLTLISSLICVYFNTTIMSMINHGVEKYFTIRELSYLMYVAFFSFLYMMINVLINRIPRDTWFFLAPLAVAIVMVFSVDYAFSHLPQHQQDRINILLGKKSDPKGSEFNIIQSKIAIGSGGISGKGFLEGTQTKAKFVPEQSTDFIFCTVGEEWGFVGSTILLVLFLVLLIRIIYVAERQRSVFTRVYGYGVASILFFHLAINIGMTIGLAPVIGIPLPFFSYGGSSLWAFTILLFIFVKLDAYRLQVLR